MNIDNLNINCNSDSKLKKQNITTKDSSVKFADELKDVKESSNKPSEEEVLEVTADNEVTAEKEIVAEKEVTAEKEVNEKTSETELEKTSTKELPENVFEKQASVDDAIGDLNAIVKELNQSDEKDSKTVKKENEPADNKNMINNEMNIQDPKDILPQMNPNMNFSGDGQPFSSFMNNQSENKNLKLSSSASDLEEEAAILSTMAENIAIANKNEILANSEKTVNREDGIKKINTTTGLTVENVVKYDSIIMNQADVEVFASIVQTGEADMNNLAPQAAEKSVQVSKTLADMLAKSMENNQPLRIDFDNNISVIIRISRDGKISADFLPSSQVAEAYLKENLPLLKQRFDDNNIEYDSLNQRERKEQNRDNNNKKDRNNE